MRETVNSRATFEDEGQRAAAAAPPQQPHSTVAPIAATSSPLPSRVPLKRPLTLDLTAKLSTEVDTKRLRFNSSVNAAPVPVLNTPDLQILKMASPELEKFMMANPSLQTPTPSLLCPSKVTSEQEDYAKGFVDALNSLRNTETSQKHHSTAAAAPAVAIGAVPTSAAAATAAAPPAASSAAPVTNNNTTTNSVVNTVGLSGGTFTYTNLDSSGASNYSNVSIKDEPQPVPSPPPHSPIDMDDQERIKLERKRQRNRVAASKCRKRKLERISKLEDKVKNLKGDNTDLAILVKQLKENVCSLKQQVIVHIKTGCNIPSSYAGGETGSK